jgi:GH24 family phage-related lysozyme (muramidase)
MDRRREMRELQPAIVRRDYREMARLFRSMRRIWEGKGLAGLLRRRETEAALCEEAAMAEGV